MNFPNDVKSILFSGKSNYLELYFSPIPHSFAPDSLQVPSSLSPDWVLIGHYIFKCMICGWQPKVLDNFDCAAKAAQSNEAVFPVPVGDSSSACFPSKILKSRWTSVASISNSLLREAKSNFWLSKNCKPKLSLRTKMRYEMHLPGMYVDFRFFFDH